MNARMRWLVGLVGLVAMAAGCQGNPKTFKYIEAMNAERRALEDQVNALTYDLDLLDDELAAAQDENDQLRRELGRDSKPAGRRGTSTPRREAPAVRRPSDDELLPPKIESGVPDEPGTTSDSASRDEPEKSNEPDEPADNPRANDGTQRAASGPKIMPAAATIATVDRQVVRVALDPARSGGADFDGQAGDDGVTIVVQPKNAAGQVVLDPATISVAILDPNRVADEARVARWDLAAKEVAKLAEEPETNRGLKLHFAWPDRPPTATLLRLYVRYTAADGEHFDAEQEIHIALSADARAGRPGWRADR